MPENPRNVALERALRLVKARENDETYVADFDAVAAEIEQEGDSWEATSELLHELVRVASTAITKASTEGVSREALLYLLGDLLRYDEEADDA